MIQTESTHVACAEPRTANAIAKTPWLSLGVDSMPPPDREGSARGPTRSLEQRGREPRLMPPAARRPGRAPRRARRSDRRARRHPKASTTLRCVSMSASGTVYSPGTRRRAGLASWRVASGGPVDDRRDLVEGHGETCRGARSRAALGGDTVSSTISSARPTESAGSASRSRFAPVNADWSLRAAIGVSGACSVRPARRRSSARRRFPPRADRRRSRGGGCRARAWIRTRPFRPKREQRFLERHVDQKGRR